MLLQELVGWNRASRLIASTAGTLSVSHLLSSLTPNYKQISRINCLSGGEIGRYFVHYELITSTLCVRAKLRTSNE